MSIREPQLLLTKYMYSYVCFDTNAINIICNQSRRGRSGLRQENWTQILILIHECKCPSNGISVLCFYIPLSWIFSFVDIRQIAFGTDLGANVLASVQLHSVSIINEFSARVSTRSSSCQFSPFSFLLYPSSFTCPRNYSLPLLFSIIVPLGPPARSLLCFPKVLAAIRKVHIRINVDGNSARTVQPCFVVHARESTSYNEEIAPCV